MDRHRIESPGRSSRPRRWLFVAAIIVILLGARSFASYLIEYEWWKEMGQTATWFAMLTYQFAPLTVATIIAFAVLWMAHARALKFAGTSLSAHPIYSRLASLVLLFIGFLVASASIDTWTVVRYMGATPPEPGAWRDPVFALPLSFYLFSLPFYSMLRGYLLALVILSVLLYWIAARGWQIRFRFPDLRAAGELDPSFFRLEGGLESRFLRGAAVVFLLALAFRYFLARYEMVWDDHGFMVGIDYVDQHIGLPLQWLMVFACLAAAAFIAFGRWLLALSMVLALVVQVAAPRLVSALYVRPNEISLERPYIQTHIHATRAAFGLEQRTHEVEFKASPDAPIDVARHKALFDNVRLWDWRAFQATISQIQALRSYYVFHDSDVDRYTIDGQYRQVLLSPRELDIQQIPDARAGWPNPHVVYTHGYGLVMATVSQIAPNGYPTLLIKDAPPQLETKTLQLTRPEIYYGEVMHEPIFVHTAQKEFNYPAEQNVFSTYDGNGGFPISSFFMRLAAAIREGDANILLTSYLTGNSRMMIRRKIQDRLQHLGAFIHWDADPYLVVTDSGRLVWMADGYTISDSHPYSRSMNVDGLGDVNYIRNAVKATIDAYDGETKFYIFAPEDPIIRAYQRLFPSLFHDQKEMPADLRAHARYPETMFRLQAEIYRVYHMLDPQAFYNKEDVWDLARHSTSQGNQPEPVTPTYVVASLPNQDKPEFLLLLPFTPRTKDNLIGLMLARCDGDHLGEIVVLQLSKQALIYGPMQIAANIDQDQTISKDLTLWNQQGSQVLRGQTLTLPVGDTFLYVEPIYLQATAARMPQLKKIVLAVGNRLIYTDTYEQALQQLTSGEPAQAAPAPNAPGSSAPATPADRRLDSIRNHLHRYRELSAQGKWAEAGKELEAIESELSR